MKPILLLFLLALMASQAWAAGAPVRMDGGDVVTPQTDISVTSSAATLIAASNANRAALNCTVDEPVRWGSSTVTITRGQLVPANASVSIINKAGIYMIAENTTATVSCTEETWTSVSSGSGVFSP